MLLKVALLLGIEIHVNVEFKGLIEPPEDQETESELNCVQTSPRKKKNGKRTCLVTQASVTHCAAFLSDYTSSAFLGIGWRAEVHPKTHPVSELEFDVIIGADGRRNTLPGKCAGTNWVK